MTHLKESCIVTQHTMVIWSKAHGPLHEPFSFVILLCTTSYTTIVSLIYHRPMVSSSYHRPMVSSSYNMTMPA